MRTFGVVVRDEEHERKPALRLGCEEAGVQAFALERVDERFGAAVRPGVVRAGAGVPRTMALAGLAEEPLEGIVGEHAPHADAARVEERERVLEEDDRVRRAQRRSQLRVDEPARQVDGDEEVAPADLVTMTVPSPLTAASAVEPADALGVDGDVPRSHDVEAAVSRALAREQQSEPVRAVSAQDAVR